MSTLFHLLAAAYRLVVALCNACIVFLQVMQLVLQEAKQEAAEVVVLLGDGASLMESITSTSTLLDASGPAKALEVLIIAKASSFVLLFRLSKRRVLHLEVDEWFIASKLEVIQTQLTLHIQHVPRLLQTPIGMHDTRLVRYMPMKPPYVWKEEQADPQSGDEVVEASIVPATSASSVNGGTEGPSRRKECVQLLKEGTLRRRLRIPDRPERVGVGAAPKGKAHAKTHEERAVKRKALANKGGTDADDALDETHGLAMGIEETPRQMRMERNIHAALSENLSIPNMVQTGSLHKVENGRRSLRRKHGQFDLYAQRASSEFSLLSQVG